MKTRTDGKTMTPTTEWVNEIVTLTREVLQKQNGTFPEHLAWDISAALSDPIQRYDMVAQLLKLCLIRPNGEAVKDAKLLKGRLLYHNKGMIVWGTRDIEAQEGFAILDRSQRIIGGKPCWIERNLTSFEERVMWFDGLWENRLYPLNSIRELQECGEIPAYSVNYRDHKTNKNIGFVVIGNSEGPRYESIERLMAAGNEPAYIAHTSMIDGMTRIYHFVLGAREVFTDYGRLYLHVAGGVAYVDRTMDDEDFTHQIWRGREKMLEAYRVCGMCVVDDQIAYAAMMTRDGPVTTCIRGETREFASIHHWWASRSGDNRFVVFDGWKPEVGVHVNYVRLCDGCVAPDEIRLADDGVTLHVQLRGEKKSCTFDLKALGII